MHIQIWSDVVCPWCYIGTTNLQQALVGIDADITFRSFQLDPSAPTEPMRTLQYLSGRYGPQAQEMMDQVTQVAARAGLEYHLRDSWSGQTLDAHRLLHLAAAEGVQVALAHRFFAAQFTQGRSLFETESLVGLCVDCGLDPDRVREVLATNEYADAVSGDIEQARRYGITGVPFVVLDDRLAVSGAQSPEVFVQALGQV